MKPRHLALAILVNLVWGLNFVAAKVGVLAIPPMWYSGIRFAIVAGLLLPFLRWEKGVMGRVFAIALFGGTLHFSMMFSGLALAEDVSAVAIATQLGTPIVTVLALIFLGEKLTKRRGAGIVLSFAGVGLMGFDPRVMSYSIALLLVVGAGLSMAIATILMRGMTRVKPLNMQGWIALTSAPGLMLVSSFAEEGQVAAMAAAPPIVWAALIYTAIGASVVGHSSMYFLLQRYPVTSVAPLMTLSPVFGVIFGILVMGDVLTWRMAIGGIIAFVGVLMTVSRESTTD